MNSIRSVEAHKRRTTMVRRDLAIVAGVISLTTFIAAYFARRGQIAGHPFGQVNALRVIVLVMALMLSFFLWQQWRELRWENRARIAAEETLRRQNGYLAALHAASVALMDRLAVEDVLATIVARAGELLDTSHGFIDLLVSDEIGLEAKVGTGLLSRDRGVPVHRGAGLSGRVWETGEPVVIDDYGTWSSHLATAPGGVCAAVGVPLGSGEQFRGVLGLAYDIPGRRFGKQEVALLVRLAHLASIALDNAQLYDAARAEIRECKQAEEQLLHSALHDALTGLPNRALFMDWLKEALVHAKRHPDTRFAVLFVDFDRFKNVNDSLGHVQGDRLLTELARRLAESLDPTCTIARLGGDEFAILIKEIADVSDATQIAEQLQQSLAQPVTLRGNEVFITASIGIALSTRGYSRPDEILRDADTAMYRAKALGAAQHVVFDAAMHARVVALLQLENDLRRAIERDEFQVLYQPVVSLTTGETTGFEALVRWQHPRLGLLAPTDFIALAEETGLILALDAWVMREACRQMRAWVVRFPTLPHFAVSVNISGKQFAQADFLNRVKGILTETGLDARRLQLEITERALIGQAETAAAALWQARAAGIQVQLDDFGIGYSSLSYLQQFPIDTLKIDRSFISNEGAHVENTEIVRAIVTLAHNLNIRVTAEGIETAAQRAHLRGLHCDFGQGYYFSPPMNGGMVERLLAEHAASPLAAD